MGENEGEPFTRNTPLQGVANERNYNTSMRKVLLAGKAVGAIPYFLAFGLTTILALVIGKIPYRGDKLFLLPWLDIVCAGLTFLVGIGILRAFGVHEGFSVTGASIGCGCVYSERAKSAAKLLRPMAGMLLGWSLYRMC